MLLLDIKLWNTLIYYELMNKIIEYIKQHHFRLVCETETLFRFENQDLMLQITLTNKNGILRCEVADLFGEVIFKGVLFDFKDIQFVFKCVINVYE